MSRSAKGINKGKFDEHTGRKVAILSRHFYLNGTKPTTYSDEFYTPPELVAALGRFDLDPCAARTTNHATRNHRRKDGCGLKLRWRGRVWLNPPYSNIHDWLDKFIRHANGICLVNSRCETAWFQQLIARADAVLFLKCRVNFIRPNKPRSHPPCGSALIAYGAANRDALRESNLAGVLLCHDRPAESVNPAATPPGRNCKVGIV